MKRNRAIPLAVLVGAAAALFAVGCARQGASGPKIVAVAVTDRGFEPREITVQRGEPVTLLVTRKTDATCAKEFVIADAGIRRELPLDRAVAIPFTPIRTGTVRYACPMDMIEGTIHVH
jgi:plastocyanin domain-containing protein